MSTWQLCGAKKAVFAALCGSRGLSPDSGSAALGGVSLPDICAAAAWSSPCTFARFYNLDVASRLLLTTTVLSLGL